MLHEARECGCTAEIGMTRAREVNYCEHGNQYRYVKALGSKSKPSGESAILAAAHAHFIEPYVEQELVECQEALSACEEANERLEAQRRGRGIDTLERNLPSYEELGDTTMAEATKAKLAAVRGGDASGTIRREPEDRTTTRVAEGASDSADAPSQTFTGEDAYRKLWHQALAERDEPFTREEPLREKFTARRRELEEMQRGWENEPGGRESGRLNYLYATRCQAMAEILREEVIPALPDYREEPCEHEWVDPSNEVVEAGDYRLCLKCKLYAIPDCTRPQAEGEWPDVWIAGHPAAPFALFLLRSSETVAAAQDNGAEIRRYAAVPAQAEELVELRLTQEEAEFLDIQTRSLSAQGWTYLNPWLAFREKLSAALAHYKEETP